MGAQRFAGVELNSIAKRDRDRDEYELKQQMRRERAKKHEEPAPVWQYRTPGTKRRGRGK